MSQEDKIKWVDIQFEDKSGNAPHWWSYRGKKLFIPCYYDIRIDWVNKRYTFDCVKDIPTINEMIANGDKILSCVPYKQCNSKLYSGKRFNAQSIVKYFNKKGYNVTLDAVEHNYNAWCCDMKSGYRDEENGYHLFTPYGCNPLQFRLSTLHPTAKDWQITYKC